MGHRLSAIRGKPVRLFRMGMAGTLGYEVHGDINDARELYEVIVEAGKPFGLQRVGWKSYSAQLCEGGYPQETFSFYGAGREDPGFIDFLKAIGIPTEVWPGSPIFGGSSGIELGKRYRNPLEIGWQRSVSFGHEFRGKAALQREAANPRRKIVTLAWNTDDVMDVYGSLFRKGDAPYKLMDFPIDNVWRTSKAGSRQHQDDVYRNGKVVGNSTSRVYSMLSRDIFSMGVLHVEDAGLGTEVRVLWGDPGTRQKEIRAVVSPYPHLELPTNSTMDVSSIPCIRG
jgi:glycine cleavage system aminomethyltransferase T